MEFSRAGVGAENSIVFRLQQKSTAPCGSGSETLDLYLIFGNNGISCLHILICETIKVLEKSTYLYHQLNEASFDLKRLLFPVGKRVETVGNEAEEARRWPEQRASAQAATARRLQW